MKTNAGLSVLCCAKWFRGSAKPRCEQSPTCRVRSFVLSGLFGRRRKFRILAAVAIVRGEHPDLMRLSCIHEELAQGLGLANDSPYARPSVFNDDEEFGF